MNTTANDIVRIETGIGKRLPRWFVDFYSKNGHGPLPDGIGGEIYSPDEIIDCLSAPIYFFLGSMTNGDEWATKEQHDEIWKSNGMKMPNAKFTRSMLVVKGYDLTNCLQIGSNGSCGYHWISLSGKPTRYCLATDAFEFENCQDDVERGIKYICTDE